MAVSPLFIAANTVSTGTTLAIPDYAAGPFTVDATVTAAGTSTATATVVVYASNTGLTNDWKTLGTITLSGTTTATDGFAFNARWKYIRGGITAIGGTGATVESVLNI